MKAAESEAMRKVVEAAKSTPHLSRCGIEHDFGDMEKPSGLLDACELCDALAVFATPTTAPEVILNVGKRGEAMVKVVEAARELLDAEWNQMHGFPNGVPDGAASHWTALRDALAALATGEGTR